METGKVVLTAEELKQMMQECADEAARKTTANLGNGIGQAVEQYLLGDMKRVKLPIPEEYGGGYATGATWYDAVEKLLSRVGKQPSTETPTFKECFERWITALEGKKRAPTTIAGYRARAKSRVIPFFGHMPIGDIKPEKIQEFFNEIGELSKSMSVQCRAILKGVFEYAEMNDLIQKSPMRYHYDLSKKVGRKVVLQDEDFLEVICGLDKLKSGFIKDYLYASILTHTELRKGEILGLQWQDIDFDANIIHIERAVKYPDGQNDPIIGAPKDNSKGTEPLFDMLAQRLKPYKGKDGEFIICYSDKETTRPITFSIHRKMMSRIRKAIDLKGATSHSFRSSYATMLNAHAKDVDAKVLQQALRHKTAGLAMEVYAKPNTEKTRTAQRQYEEYLSQALEQRLEHCTVSGTA